MRYSILLVINIYILLIITSCVKTEVDIYGTICGQILSSEDSRIPIDACVITLGEKETNRTVSDEAGYYEFSPIEIGVHNIKVSKKGYITKQDSVQITSAKPMVFDILLTKITPPNVHTKAAEEISFSSAILKGEIYDNGGGTIIQRGFYIGEKMTELRRITIETDKDVYAHALSCLEDGKKYYFQAFALNEAGESVGELLSFCTTEYTFASIRAFDVENLSQTEAVLKAEIASEGNSEIVEFGFIYHCGNGQEKQIPVSKMTSKNIYDYLLKGLQDGTTYYYKAYVINKKGMSYSNEVSFTTLKYSVPTVITKLVDNCSYNSAVVHCYLDSNGGAEIISCGVCFGKNSNPSLKDNVVECKLKDNTFIAQLQNIEAGTQYFVRSYAKNKEGISYGNQLSFSTPNYGLPTIEVKEIKNVTYDSADIKISILNDGGAVITETGVCYSTSSSPMKTDHFLCYNGSEKDFVLTINKILPGTTYFVRPYAINSCGISYGNNMSFNTLKYDPPQFGPISVSDIQYTSFVVQCSVDYNGSIKERGFCYNSKKITSIENNYKVKLGIGVGEYMGNIKGLDYSTTYYLRSYAIDEIGNVFYSDEYTVETSTPQSVFSIGAGKKVTFSRGNLLYNPNNDKWMFATEQYSYVASTDGWIHYFGWGTGKNPTESSSLSTNYNSFTDWGENTIGTETKKSWRTLSYDEWDYIINKRKNASKLHAMARVGNTCGLIILSDNFLLPSGISFTPNTKTFTSNVYNLSTWEQLEKNGAIFLPAAGSKNGSSPWHGRYWTCTKGYNPYTSDILAYSLCFEEKDKTDSSSVGGVCLGLSYSYAGYSVRLVQNLN